MTMPKATIYKNDSFLFEICNVWSAWQPSYIGFVIEIQILEILPNY